MWSSILAVFGAYILGYITGGRLASMDIEYPTISVYRRAEAAAHIRLAIDALEGDPERARELLEVALVRLDE